MPLYEYVCDQCTHQFEELGPVGATPPCPRCHTAGPRRVMSVTAVARTGERETATPAPGACGSCGDPRGPGACSMS